MADNHSIQLKTITAGITAEIRIRRCPSGTLYPSLCLLNKPRQGATAIIGGCFSAGDGEYFRVASPDYCGASYTLWLGGFCVNLADSIQATEAHEWLTNRAKEYQGIYRAEAPAPQAVGA